MASVNWQKQTRQKASAMKKHNGQKERMQYNHANKQIDKSLTPNNYCIGCDDYNASYDAMIKRVEKVDREYPPEKVVKDRKICCSLETPCPLEITQEGRSREFFEAVHDIMVDFFGEENTHGACVHLDEVHDYVDEKTGELKTSLEHSTELVSCYAEWKDPVWERDENGKIQTELYTDKNGNQKERKVQAKDENGNLLYSERKGINGKHFETRSALNELNKRVCDMVRERFGIEYNTGEQPRGKTVETLKAQTTERVAKQKAEQAQVELANIREQVQIASLRAVEIPPRPIELELIQKPEQPKDPRTVMYWRKEEYRDYLLVQMPAWKKECKSVDKQNALINAQNAQIRQKQAEWDNLYLPVQMCLDEADRLAKQRAEQEERAVQQQRTAEVLNQREQLIEKEVQRRCEEQLARSDKYARFRTNQQSSLEYQRKLQEIYKTAEERNNSYENNSFGANKDSGTRPKSLKEQGDR